MSKWNNYLQEAYENTHASYVPLASLSWSQEVEA